MRGVRVNHSFWRRVVDAGTRVVLPDVCAGCGISGAWICDDCMQSVKAVNQQSCCQRCGHPESQAVPFCRRCLDWPETALEVRGVFEFSGALRSSILRMKYHGEYARASWHGTHLADLIREVNWDADVLVPVPLHAKRLKSRGYNQSEHLARAVSVLVETDVEPYLGRVINTPSQTALSRDRRVANVAGAFTCSPRIAGKRAIIIDDVTTTCSTVLECAIACERAGAASVRAMTVATDV